MQASPTIEFVFGIFCASAARIFGACAEPASKKDVRLRARISLCLFDSVPHSQSMKRDPGLTYMLGLKKNGVHPIHPSSPTNRDRIMPNTPFISIVMPSRGRPEKLESALLSLEETLRSYRAAEVIVAYDGEEGGPSRPSNSWPSAIPLTFLRLDHRGPAAARNRALEHARGDLLLFLNDDIEASPHLLEEHVRAHRESTHPKSVLGGFVFSETLRRDPFCRLLEDAGFTHTKFLGPTSIRTTYTSFWTANLSVPRSAVEAVGGFDPLFTEPSCEDIDLGYRLKKELDLELLYAPKAIVHHNHPHHPEMWRRRNRMMGRNTLRLFSKHGIGCDAHALMHERRFIPERVQAFRNGLQEQDAAIDSKRRELESLLAQAAAKEQKESSRDGTSRMKDARMHAMALLLRDIDQHDSLSGFADALWAHLPREAASDVRVGPS